MTEEIDKPLDEDIAELNREGQKAVDRNIRARQELADSEAELDAFLAKVASGSQAALDYVKAYRNPAEPTPEPIAPEAHDDSLPMPDDLPIYVEDFTAPAIDDTANGQASAEEPAAEPAADDEGI